ncbi:Tat pathway signal sequence domain protein [Pseudomonas sp. Marseille-QA0332]
MSFQLPLELLRLTSTRCAARHAAKCLVLALALPVTTMAGTESTPCAEQVAGQPVQVDSICVDPDYAKPVIDKVVDLSSPLEFRHVSGHFAGTEVTFNFYLPPKPLWAGRFFHHVYPFTDGLGTQQELTFAYESGAYLVKTGGSSGYRADAAAAKFSRQVARDYYAGSRPKVYGYVYGGSGGSYQTIAAMENSVGVWDGAVPYVIGTPTSIPNNFFARVFARVVLSNKAAAISDAMKPGGSGDPYGALNEVERAALREVSTLGVPLKGWADPAYLLGLGDPKGLMGFRDTVKQFDPGYAADFWSKPGYLGTEKSPLGELMRNALVEYVTPITALADAPDKVQLQQLPKRGFTPEYEYTFLDRNRNALAVLPATLDVGTRVLTVDADAAKLGEVLSKARFVRMDNRWALALAALHRHQVPADKSFAAWNQYRRADGTAVYPQRSEIGPMISQGAAGGGPFTGDFKGKMIIVGNLLDLDAYPWDADWYAGRVKQHLGEHANSRFRVWYNENADHHDGSVIVSGKTRTHEIHLVSYVGMLEQALRDLSAWVESDTAPPASTSYSVVQGQVEIAAQTRQRHGIQPAVRLAVAGRSAVKVAPGQALTLQGTINTPPGTGQLVAVEWSADGSDEFVAKSVPASSHDQTEVTNTLRYDVPGIYYPVLRVTTERSGNARTSVARVQNLARVRVEVSQRAQGSD